jgi:hypothetical protein
LLETETLRAPRPRQGSSRLVLEVSAGWASPSSRGLWGGEALLLSTEQEV